MPLGGDLGAWSTSPIAHAAPSLLATGTLQAILPLDFNCMLQAIVITCQLVPVAPAAQ